MPTSSVSGGGCDARGRRLVEVARLVAFAILVLGLQALLYGNLFQVNRLSIDNSIYTGFILSPEAHYHNFPNTYYGGRVPYIAVGVGLTSVFGDHAGLILCRLGFLLLFASAVCGWFWSALGKRAAWLGFGLCLTLPEILFAFSNDYVSQAAMTFTAISFLLAELAARNRGGRRALWAMGCGGVFLATVSTNLFMVVNAPILAVYFLFRTADGKRFFTLLKDAAFALIGAVLAYGLVEVISVSLGNGWNHLLPSIRFASSTVLQPNPWNPADLSWLQGAFWLVLPAVALGFALAGLWTEFRAGNFRLGADSGRVAMGMAWLATALIYGGYQVTGHPILVFSFFSVLLLPLAVGGILSHRAFAGPLGSPWVAPAWALALLGALLTSRWSIGWLLDSGWAVGGGLGLLVGLVGVVFLFGWVPRAMLILFLTILSQIFVVAPSRDFGWLLEYPETLGETPPMREHLTRRREEDPSAFLGDVLGLHRWIYETSDGEKITFDVEDTDEPLM